MNILDSVKIKNVYSKNRIVMPPLASERAIDGKVIDAVFKFYMDRCGGGNLGLVITEHCYIVKQGQASPRQLSIADDSCIEGLSSLTAKIKACGSPVFCQINHAGARAKSKITGEAPVSSTADSKGGVEELSADRIHEICSLFADAALRAKKAGYDGVELHAAHRYLLNQFFSPVLNKRHDEYGADSLENRMRFMLEAVKAIRNAVGEDYPLAVRLGACDYMEGGSTVSDGVEAAKLLEKAGVDLLDISGGACGTTVPGKSGARFADAAEAIKKAVSVPVILTGGIRDAALAKELIDNGCADLIGIGSALVENPHWADEQIGVKGENI